MPERRRTLQPILESARNAAVYAEYVIARGERRVPRRQDIDPVRIKRQLPYVYMVRVVPEGDRICFQIRLMGTELVAVLKQEGTGRYVGDLDLGGWEKEWRQSLLHAYAVGVPVVAGDSIILRSGLTIDIEHLALPLSEDGMTVSGVFGVFDFPRYRDSELFEVIDKVDWNDIDSLEVPKRLLITNLSVSLDD